MDLSVPNPIQKENITPTPDAPYSPHQPADRKNDSAIESMSSMRASRKTGRAHEQQQQSAHNHSTTRDDIMKELEDYVNEKKAHKYLDDLSDGEDNAPAGEKEMGVTPGGPSGSSMPSTAAAVDRSLNHSNSQASKPRSSRKIPQQHS